MYATLVECVQQLHEIIDVHRPRPLFPEVNLCQNFVHHCLHVYVFRHLLPLDGQMDAVVLLEHHESCRLPEGCAERLVLAHKGNPR